LPKVKKFNGGPVQGPRRRSPSKRPSHTWALDFEAPPKPTRKTEFEPAMGFLARSSKSARRHSASATSWASALHPPRAYRARRLGHAHHPINLREDWARLRAKPAVRLTRTARPTRPHPNWCADFHHRSSDETTSARPLRLWLGNLLVSALENDEALEGARFTSLMSNWGDQRRVPLITVDPHQVVSGDIELNPWDRQRRPSWCCGFGYWQWHLPQT